MSDGRFFGSPQQGADRVQLSSDPKPKNGPQSHGCLRIGDAIAMAGRRYRIVGFDPMGVERPCAYLEDTLSGEEMRVPIERLRRAEVPD